jgi:hypothetical protein
MAEDIDARIDERRKDKDFTDRIERRVKEDKPVLDRLAGETQRVPEAAVEALARELADEHGEKRVTAKEGYYRIRARNLVLSAYPAILSDLRSRLLSDEAKTAAWRALPDGVTHGEAVDALSAALDTLEEEKG